MYQQFGHNTVHLLTSVVHALCNSSMSLKRNRNSYLYEYSYQYWKAGGLEPGLGTVSQSRSGRLRGTRREEPTPYCPCALYIFINIVSVIRDVFHSTAKCVSICLIDKY